LRLSAPGLVSTVTVALTTGMARKTCRLTPSL
jgi:hypothetical protein